MRLDELAQFKLPTAEELKDMAPPEAEQWASEKRVFSWDALAYFCAARAVGISVEQAADAAGFTRGSWYAWKNEENEMGPWLTALQDRWKSYGASCFAARVAVLTGNSDPNIAGVNARWLAERTSTDHAAPPKREAVRAEVTDQGTTIVIERMDETPLPPQFEEGDGEG